MNIDIITDTTTDTEVCITCPRCNWNDWRHPDPESEWNRSLAFKYDDYAIPNVRDLVTCPQCGFTGQPLGDGAIWLLRLGLATVRPKLGMPVGIATIPEGSYYFLFPWDQLPYFRTRDGLSQAIDGKHKFGPARIVNGHGYLARFSYLPSTQ
jgi:hypothetical protein